MSDRRPGHLLLSAQLVLLGSWWGPLYRAAGHSALSVLLCLAKTLTKSRSCSLRASHLAKLSVCVSVTQCGMLASTNSTWRSRAWPWRRGERRRARGFAPSAPLTVPPSRQKLTDVSRGACGRATWVISSSVCPHGHLPGTEWLGPRHLGEEADPSWPAVTPMTLQCPFRA